MSNFIKVLPVSKIFENNSYVIPIYQRNYAWGELEIQQLIDDIDSAINHHNKNYFLGSLIVNQTDHNVYEVIDGQQRLTTLFLLERYLQMSIENDALRFEAREKSNRTLKKIGKEESNDLLEDLQSPEIVKGYQIIKNYLETNIKVKEALPQKLYNVYLVKVQVPQGIDLNHYFEIMNTRGEQLELHEIAKAKFLEVLETEDDKKIAALIWEKCSNMDSYVQMNFDTKVRKELFTEDWSSLNDEIYDFDSIRERVPPGNDVSKSIPLIERLKNNERLIKNEKKKEVDSERFESILSFPNFLLQVNASIKGDLDEEDTTLDDKHFLNNLSWAWKDAESAKNFLYHMLKCRVLFDKYILKREYARNYKESGKWSLQKLEKYDDGKGEKPQYVNTFGKEDSKNNNLIKTLQASLRITYTSPKTMHWITEVLTELLKNDSNKDNLLSILENYCKPKVEKVIESDANGARGFQYQRIIFTYLDYLLYKNGYLTNRKHIIKPMDDVWEIQFRNSIEHFYPQNPDAGGGWNQEDLDDFGNLALISVTSNSKFSNLPPEAKIRYNDIINESLKLKIMKELVIIDGHGWTKEKAKQHKEEMFRILEEHINSGNVLG